MPIVAVKPQAPIAQTGAPARQIWRQIPENCLVLDGRVIPIEEEITTREAARLLRKAIRTVQELCNGGHLHEGIDWCRRPAANGGPARYRIRKAAILRILQNSQL